MNPAHLRSSWYLFSFQLPWLPERTLRRRDWALLIRVLRNTSPPGVFSDLDLEHYKTSWAKKDALTAMLNWYRAALLRPSKFALDSKASRVKVPALLIWGKTTSLSVKQWPEKVFSIVMMDTLKCLRLRPIGSNMKSPHKLIPYCPNSSPN
jgi:hypothetical protein